MGLDKTVELAKALADGNRVRALCALQEGERCVCQIITLLGLAPSTVSRHMSILRQAGLVESRKDGRWIHYRLPDAPPRAVAEALDWMRECVRRDPVVREDRKQIRTLKRQDAANACAACAGKGAA